MTSPKISFDGYEAVFVFYVISGFLIAIRIMAGGRTETSPGQTCLP
jgi:peptidoglycan/LPS O-acetylase OafA/YrhL